MKLSQGDEKNLLRYVGDGGKERKSLPKYINSSNKDNARRGNTPISNFSITTIHFKLILRTERLSYPSHEPPHWKFAFNVLARDKALLKFNLFMNNFSEFAIFYLF